MIASAAPWWRPGSYLLGCSPAVRFQPGVNQSIWIDMVTLLPLRWSMSMPAMPERGVPAIPDYGLSFTYDASLDLRPPDVTLSTDCVP